MTARPRRRRDVLRSAALTTTAALVGACAPAGPSPAVSTPAGSTPAAPAPRPAAAGAATRRGGVLIVYFSRPGENYWYGGRRELAVGPTETLVGMLAGRLRCRVHRVEAARPYPRGYDATVARNVAEQQQDARPAVAGPLPDARDVRTVVLASPVWNVRPPMIMSTVVEGLDLTGATVLPLTTHAMSGLGTSAQVYADLAPGATIGTGLAVRGEDVADAGPALDAWIARALPVG